MTNHDDDHTARFRLRRKRKGGDEQALAPKPVPDEAVQATPDTETALVHRLRQMDWPTPPPGVRERCLDQLLGYMDSLKEEDAAELGIPEPMRRFDSESASDQEERKNPPRGLEQRHNSTVRSMPGERRQVRLAERPVRLAAVL